MSRTALGPVILARVLLPGRVIIAGPTLLRKLRRTLDQLHEYGARLMIIDGAINQIGASAPDATGACILRTGASAGGTPELITRLTADILTCLSAPQTHWKGAY